MKRGKVLWLGAPVLILILGVLIGRLSLLSGGALIRAESGAVIPAGGGDLGAWQPPREGSADRRININTASAAQLGELPGIGPVIAERIVNYREENGPFAEAEDIRAVKGIGEKIYADIAGMITVSQTGDEG